MSVEVTFALHATNVALDVDLESGVSLEKLLNLSGSPVTGVMYETQGKWKMLDVEGGYAKPKNNDWGIAQIFHLFPTSSPRSKLGGQDVQV